jgi:nucleotide-binding universal stress UspA family protein
MRLLSRLEAKQKSGAIRYLLFRQSPKHLWSKAMLPEIKKILYTTNLGANTRPVLQFAVSLAKQHDAKLYLLHVVEPLSDSGSLLMEAYLSEEMAQKAKELAAKMREETSQHILDKIKSRVERFCAEDLGATPEQQSQLFGDIRVVSGSPAEMIVRESESLDVDLIIVGSHQTGSTLKSAFLGSTARKVTHLSKKPVLVVPMPETETWGS